MYNYLRDNTAPNDPRMVKRIQNNTSRYVINDGLLYHIWHFKANDTLQSHICIPEVYHTEIMQALHDLKTTGHAGVMKMYHSALQKCWWPGMFKSFENYVGSCETCLQSNKGHYPKVALNPLPVPNGVLDTIHLDMLSIKTPSNGFKYMIVIIDGYSKLIAVKALKSKHANVVAKAVYSDWFMKYGFPKHISYAINDNGLEFKNNWSSVLYELINVKSIRTTPYKPSSNSQVEVTNKHILGILRKLTKDEPKKMKLVHTSSSNGNK